MNKIDFLIEKNLSVILGINSKELTSAKTEIKDSIEKLKPILNLESFPYEYIEYLTDFYKEKKSLMPFDKIESLAVNVTENKLFYLPLIKSLCLINIKEDEENQNELKKFFNSLYKKNVTCAAELGDEKNPHFLKACLKVIDFSFTNIIQKQKIDVSPKNIVIKETFNEDFKKALWAEIDKNIELLKTLKEEIFGKKDILSEFINLETKKPATKNVTGLSNDS